MEKQNDKLQQEGRRGSNLGSSSPGSPEFSSAGMHHASSITNNNNSSLKKPLGVFTVSNRFRSYTDNTNEYGIPYTSRPGSPTSSVKLDATRLYVTRCREYKMSPDPSILACLETEYEIMKLTPQLCFEGCLLPLIEVLSLTDFVKTLIIIPHEKLRKSRRNAQSGDIDARCLWKIMLENKSIETLDISHIGLGLEGMKQLGEIVKVNTTLKRLNISHNSYALREGHEILENDLMKNKTLEMLDVSYNWLGYRSVQKMRKSMTKHGGKVIANGNYVIEETLNAITHFLGFVIAIAAVSVLLYHASSSRKLWWASLLYGITLLLMYACSSIFHSAFLYPEWSKIFNVMDHSAIYLLICGSSTPFAVTALKHSPMAIYIHAVQWVIAVVGISFSVYTSRNHVPGRIPIELALYLTQGYVAFALKSDLEKSLGDDCVQLLMLTALSYSVGTIFFVAEHAVHPIGHTIWHICVILGTAFHYFAVLLYVVGIEEQVQKSPTSFFGQPTLGIDKGASGVEAISSGAS